MTQLNPSSPTDGGTTTTTVAHAAGTLSGTVTLNSFENFVYINLPSRTDRRGRIESVLANMHVDMNKVHRVEAMSTPGLGAQGCAFSHMKAIDLALENKWNHVVIFEDDFKFSVPPEEVTKRLTAFFAAYTTEWDVLMFVGNIVTSTPSKCDGVVQAKEVLAASGYVVNQRFFATLRGVYEASYNELSKPECKLRKNSPPWQEMHECRPLDVLWMPAMGAAQWFVCRPGLGQQIDGFYSDIENRPVWYHADGDGRR